ncbi:nucleotidyltransferase-like protein [Bacillus sp. B-jedd]|uniref:nucleotidyltransferase-like protein n=1 Tax=Bacillus sp. B-jedd TaxID=1476857 RepID=UPI0005157163|nr:nucleotidyltransferase-like protein [Bacillus sp. B-jedd]CEG25941.1 YgxA [Bacillus sp. B-jedd]
MEDILRPIYQERASQANTLGVLVVEKKEKNSPATDFFDAILLVIVNDADEPITIKHYSYGTRKAALHTITESTLQEWMLLGTNKKIFEWLYSGKVVFDRNEYFKKLLIEFRDFPFYGRKIKMGIEFAKLIRRYLDGKAFFDNGQYLDAFNHVVHSLHHLARLAVIENGFHPELTVWNQVKQIDPELFKLYEELVTSDEGIEKRLELLFLASEFLIHSRTKVGAAHLLDVLKTKDEWTIGEIMNDEELKHYSVDLSVLLEYLAEKQLVEAFRVETKSAGLFHRYYRIGYES